MSQNSKKSNCDKKTQIVTKLKKLNCDKLHNQIVTKIKNLNSDI